jgi:hypothetical protein
MEEILNRTIFARCQRRFEVRKKKRFFHFLFFYLIQELKETILSTTNADSIY